MINRLCGPSLNSICSNSETLKRLEFAIGIIVVLGSLALLGIGITSYCKISPIGNAEIFMASGACALFFGILEIALSFKGVHFGKEQWRAANLEISDAPPIPEALSEELKADPTLMAILIPKITFEDLQRIGAEKGFTIIQSQISNDDVCNRSRQELTLNDMKAVLKTTQSYWVLWRKGQIVGIKGVVNTNMARIQFSENAERAKKKNFINPHAIEVMICLFAEFLDQGSYPSCDIICDPFRVYNEPYWRVQSISNQGLKIQDAWNREFSGAHDEYLIDQPLIKRF